MHPCRLRTSLSLAILLITGAWSPRAASAGIIDTIAGGGVGDGRAATNAFFQDMRGLAVDAAGNVFISDNEAWRVRKVATDGTITTVMGSGAWGYPTEGLATNSGINGARGIALDVSGRLYVALPYAVWRVDTDGHMSSVGVSSSSLQDVAIDGKGNVYVADSYNDVVHMVDTGGVVSVVAGNGTRGYSGDGSYATNAMLNQPYAVACDAQNRLLIADTWNQCIRRVDAAGIITTVAGPGDWEHLGDGGPATNAYVGIVHGLCFDDLENLYLAGGNRVRCIDTNGIINTVAGDGNAGFSGDGGQATSAELVSAACIAIGNSGELFIGDSSLLSPALGERYVRKVDGTGTITTFAGYGVGDGGPATGAALKRPHDVGVSADGRVFIAERDGHRIRMIDDEGLISTVAGGGSEMDYSQEGRPATDFRLGDPLESLAVDVAGNIYFPYSDRVFKVDTDGIMSRVAGTGAQGYSGDGGPATNAMLLVPTDVALDGLGNLYISDRYNHVIRRVDAAGTITTVAGTGTSGAEGDGGPATNANLSYPESVAADTSGNLYITMNDIVRKVDTSGIIDMFAGPGVYGNLGDGGPATDAYLGQVDHLDVDAAGNLYIAARQSSRIRMVDTSGIIHTVAGGAISADLGDGGPATNAVLNNCYGVAVDSQGHIYVADTFNERVRRVGQSPAKPTNLAPTDGAAGVDATPMLQSSAFSDTEPGRTHGASQWQLRAATGTYDAAVLNTGVDPVNLTALTVGPGVLHPSEAYSWRIRHQDDMGAWSYWSDETAFETTNLPPVSPQNVAPTNGATGVSLAPRLESSAYNEPDGHAHAASQWQMTLIPGSYGTPHHDTGEDLANLVALDLAPAVVRPHTTYYWHVRHKDDHGAWSDWSAETSFTTTNRIPDQPLNTMPVDGSVGLPLSPTLRCSAFADLDVGDTHAASHWQIREDGTGYGSAVLDTGSDSANLTNMTVTAGVLDGATRYYWHIRHRDDFGGWSTWSLETSFSTTNRSPHSPMNVSPSNGSVHVSLAPLLVSSEFVDPDGKDIHAASRWQIAPTPGDYANAVFDTGRTNALLELQLPPGVLTYTSYWWRALHEDPHGAVSEWSLETGFDTAPTIDDIQPVGSNEVLQFPTATGYLYTVRYSTNLLVGVWTNVPGMVDIPGNGNYFRYTNELPFGSGLMFRTLVRPAP